MCKTVPKFVMCFVQGYLGDDCSQEAVGLQYGVMLQREETAAEYDYFQLPPGEPVSSWLNV